MPVQNSSRTAGVSFALFCLALILTAYSARNPWVSRLGSSALLELQRPFQSVFHGSVGRAGGVWEDYVALIGVNEENKILRERIEALESDNSRYREYESEISRLRSLLGTLEDHHLEGIAADVIGYDPSNWVRSITIDKGSRQGIAVNMPVIAGDAVVGQVIAVSFNSARVLLITDHSSGVDALAQQSRVRGVVQGVGKELCEMRFVMQEDVLTVGDRVVTSGMDGVYPKGLLIGIVAEVRQRGDGMFQTVRVKPGATLARLETVLVVTQGAPVSEEIPAVIPPALEGKKQRKRE